MNMQTSEQRYDKLFNIFSSPDFLNKHSGIDVTVPIYLYSYPVEQEAAIMKVRETLIKNLYPQGINIHDISLYRLALDILQEKGYLQRIFDLEAKLSKEELLETLQNLLSPEKDLVPEILRRGRMKNEQPISIIFLSDVARVYPYIRGHSVLNALQDVSRQVPIVMFYPGEYGDGDDRSCLKLFGRIPNGNYYRISDLEQYR